MNKKQNLSWNEYLFRDRHKEYGAYQLRINEGWDLLKSLMIVISFVGMLTLTLSFTTKGEVITNPEPAGPIVSPTVVEFDKDKKDTPEKEEIKPEAVKPKPKPKVNKKLDSDIIPDPKESPKKETPINKNDDIGKTESDDGTESNGDSGIKYIDDSGDETGTGINPVPQPAPAPQPVKTEDNTVYNARDITSMAIFPGCEKAGKDKKALQDCMSEKLQSELGMQLTDFKDIADSYRIDKAAVRLYFVVDKTGKITEIRQMGGGNKVFGDEAQKALKRVSERMIKRGSYIKPAELEDGSKVNMNFTIPLRFVTQ